MKRAIIAGSFDPIHKGHLSIIEKATDLFDEVFVVIANNDFKKEQSNIRNRLNQVIEKIKLNNVKIFAIENKYLATFAKENKIKYLVRSARNNADYKYELDLAKLNKEINNELETILIVPEMKNIDYSSSNFRNFKIDPKK